MSSNNKFLYQQIVNIQVTKEKLFFFVKIGMGEETFGYTHREIFSESD